jgi:hypothetical protein
MVFGQSLPALSSGHFQAPFELFKNIGKTSKSSVPVLSEGLLYSLLSTLLAALGFSHFWPIACPIYSQLSTLYSLTAPW